MNDSNPGSLAENVRPGAFSIELPGLSQSNLFRAPEQSRVQAERRGIDPPNLPRSGVPMIDEHTAIDREFDTMPEGTTNNASETASSQRSSSGSPLRPSKMVVP